MNKEVQIIISAKDMASRAMKNISSSLSSMTGTIKSQVAAVGSSVRTVMSSAEQLALPMASAAGGMIYVGNNMVKAAHQAQMGGILFEKMVQRVGGNFQIVSSKAQTLAERLKIPLEVIQQNTSELLRLGYNFNQIEEIYIGAAASGMLVGKSTAESINLVNQSLVTGLSVYLNQIGIMQNLGPATQAYAKSLDKTTDELTDAERATAAYQMITKATAAEVSELPTLLKGYGGAVADFDNQLYKAKVMIGTELLPVWTEWLGRITNVVKTFNTLDQPHRNFLFNLGKTAAIAVAAAAGIGLIAQALSIAGRVFSMVGGIVSIATSPIVLGAIAIAAVAGIIYAAWNQNWGGLQTTISGWADAVVQKFDMIKNWWNKSDLKQIIINAWEELKTIWTDPKLTLPQKVIQTAEVAVKSVLLTGLELLKMSVPILVEITDLAITGLEQLNVNIPGITKELNKSINDIFKSLLDWTKKNSGKLWDDVVEFGKKIGELIIEGIKAAFNITVALSDILRNTTSGLRKILDEWTKTIRDWQMNKAGSSIKNIQDDFTKGLAGKSNASGSFFKGLYDLGNNMGYILMDAFVMVFDLGEIILRIIAGAIQEIGAALVNLGSQIAGEITRGIVNMLPKFMQERLPLNIQLLAGLDVTDVVNKNIKTLTAYKKINDAIAAKDYKTAQRIFLTDVGKWVGADQFNMTTAFNQLREEAKKAASQVYSFLNLEVPVKLDLILKDFNYSTLIELQNRVNMFNRKNVGDTANVPKNYFGGIIPGKFGPDQYLTLVAPGEAIVPSSAVNQGKEGVLNWFKQQGVPGFYTGKAPSINSGNVALDSQINATSQWLNQMGSFFTKVGTAIVDIISKIGQLIVKVVEKIAPDFANEIKGFFNEFGDILNIFKTSLTEPSTTDSGYKSPVATGAGNADTSESKKAGNYVIEAWDRLMIGLRSDWEVVADLWKDATEKVGNAKEWLQKPWKDKLADIKNILGNIGVAVRGVAGGMAGQIVSNAPIAQSVIQGATQGSAAGPMGAVVGGLVGLISESATFQKLMANINPILQMVSDTFGKILEPLLPVIQVIGAVLAPILSVLGTILSTLLVPVMRPLFEGLKIIGAVVALVAAAFYGLMYVSYKFGEGVMRVVNWIVTLIPGLKDLEKSTQELADKFAEKAKEAGQQAEDQLQAAKDLISLTWEEAMAKAENVDATKKATDAVAQIPEIFKIALARFQSADTENGSIPVSNSSSATSNTYVPSFAGSTLNETSNYNVTVQVTGQVYGVEDLEEVIDRSVREAIKRAQEDKDRKSKGKSMALVGRGRMVTV